MYGVSQIIMRMKEFLNNDSNLNGNNTWKKLKHFPKIKIKNKNSQWLLDLNPPTEKNVFSA